MNFPAAEADMEHVGRVRQTPQKRRDKEKMNVGQQY